jgi:hypothetical protein
MRVVVKEPGRDPEVREVSGELRMLQAIVGGYIEHVASIPLLDVVVYGNEEGRLQGLPYNFTKVDGTVIVGTVVAVRVDEEGADMDLDERTAGHVCECLRALAGSGSQ